MVDGQDVVADVHEVLDRMGDFTDRLRSGEWTGATGERITTVVNIGIGGSDLGPGDGVPTALRHYADAGISARFVSNVDPADLVAKLDGLDPATTLFIVASKTFSTLETLTNATAARRWLTDALGDAAVSKHFVAVSTNKKLVDDFGINTDNMFGFWDWVGGRYSVDSAIGLSVMAVIGRERFADFLAGLPPRRRALPHRAAGGQRAGAARPHRLWYNNFFGAQTRAVLPYSNDLSRFAAYLQQLTMESNGKSVRADGTPVTTSTGEIFWGEPGTNGQHAFYQLLHQGTRLIPADFIGFSQPTDDLPTADGTGSMHDLLMSNFFAQTQVLAFGKTAEEIAAEGTPPEVVPHKVMPGNRPTTSILGTKLTPSVVGQLIALYEHQVFTEGRHLGHRLVRPVGRRAGQDPGQGAAAGDHQRRVARRAVGLVDRRAGASLPHGTGPQRLAISARCRSLSGRQRAEVTRSAVMEAERTCTDRQEHKRPRRQAQPEPTAHRGHRLKPGRWIRPAHQAHRGPPHLHPQDRLKVCTVCRQGCSTAAVAAVRAPRERPGPAQSQWRQRPRTIWASSSSVSRSCSSATTIDSRLNH